MSMKVKDSLNQGTNARKVGIFCTAVNCLWAEK